MQSLNPINEARKIEHLKYEKAYKLQTYRMGDARKIDAEQDVRAFFHDHQGHMLGLTYLDVGCGRGEMLDLAISIGFSEAKGLEVVETLIDNDRVSYGEIYAMPLADKTYDLVTTFDVLEHIHRADTVKALDELMRVARCGVILTANNRPSMLPSGEDLHINKMSYSEWDLLIRQCAQGRGEVTWISNNRHYVSETWRIDLHD